MLSALTSLPISALSATSNFFTSRRRGFAYAAATVGTAYVAGKWALGRLGESQEQARKDGWGRDDLARRFNLNLQDSQFTVLALLPTLAAQVQDELDVESRTKELARRAREERERKVREAEEEERRRREGEEEAERVRVEEEEAQEQAQIGTEAEAVVQTTADDVTEGGEGQTTEQEEKSDEAQPIALSDPVNQQLKNENSSTPSTTSSSSLNPDAPSFSFNPSAPAFDPSSTSSFSASAETSSTPPESDTTASSLSNAADHSPSTAGNEFKGGAAAGGAETAGEAVSAPTAKSWATVVKEGVADEAPSLVVQQGVAASAEKPITPPTDPDTPPVSAPASSPASANGTPSTADAVARLATEVPPAEQQENEDNPLAGKSKVDLWNEIKILSFTRLLTSLYLLPLLTSQTHIHLALLGRTAYISSLLSTLPPRTPSPPPSKPLPLPLPHFASSTNATEDDGDLEQALYEAKKLPLTREEREQKAEEERKEIERCYLTFSWWLLHEGWKVVEKRVRGAVEDVVGPMGLKTPVVYGELGALLGQLRRRIELDDETGKAFDFSAALHPPTYDLEISTLVAGGSWPLSSSSSSSSPSPSAPPSTSTVPSSYPPPTLSTSPSTPSQPDPLPPALRALLSETSDSLASPDGALVRSLMLDRLFSLVIEKVEPAFSPRSSPGAGAHEATGSRGARFEDVTERSTKLAALLPALARLTSSDGEGTVLGRGLEGNEWVEAMEGVHEGREFWAVVYGGWDRDELR